MIFALAWAVPVGLLSLILVAIVFPRLLRGLFFIVAIFALFAWGAGMNDQIAKTPDGELPQKTELEPADAALQDGGNLIPVDPPAPDQRPIIDALHSPDSFQQFQEYPSGAQLCLLNGRSWMTGPCARYTKKTLVTAPR